MSSADIADLARRIIAPKRAAVAVLGPKPAMKSAVTFERTLFG